MNKKGFTLVELLGVLVLLSIVMLIAIPNITSILEKNKRETYLSDATKLIALAKTKVATGKIDKPATGTIYKVTLGYLGTNDVKNDPDGEKYDVNNSYVIIFRKDDELKYYVNLVSNNSGEYKGISLTSENSLTDKENRMSLISKDITLLENSGILTEIGISGTIQEFKK